MNEERKGKHYINLVGIGIGNGMTNPMLQEPQVKLAFWIVI
jgi:hypothetical protein